MVSIVRRNYLLITCTLRGQRHGDGKGLRRLIIQGYIKLWPSKEKEYLGKRTGTCFLTRQAKIVTNLQMCIYLLRKTKAGIANFFWLCFKQYPVWHAQLVIRHAYVRALRDECKEAHVQCGTRAIRHDS